MSQKTTVAVSAITVTLIIVATLAGLSYFGVLSIAQSDNSTYVQPEISPAENSSDNLLGTSEPSQSIFNSTVTIYTTGRQGGLSSTGSGFLYTDDHIMTNEHVVSSQDEVYVKYYEGEWTRADVIGTDVHSDVAILEPDNVPRGSDPIPMQTELPERGETVVAIGSPNGLEDSISTGIVSGVERSVKIQTPFSVPDSIQTDAALNPGNSGGPLIDPDSGGVIGVNRATEGENIGHAVSSRLADTIGKSLIATGNHSHSYIGIVTVPLNPLTEEDYDVEGTDSGIVVAETFEDTPGGETFNSAQNGTPDVITRIGDEKVQDNEDLASYLLRETIAGDTIEFTIYRDGERRTVDLITSSRAQAEDV